MKRLNRVYPLTASADQQTDIRLLANWWFKETAGATAEVKIYGEALGEPSAPTAALVTIAGAVTSGAHTYKITAIDANGESEPSAASNSVTTVEADHGKVTVTWTAVPGATGYNVYRNEAAGAPGTHKLVAASPVVASGATVTYLDNTADAGRVNTSPPTTNTTGTMLFDIPLTANQQANLPASGEFLADCGSEVWVESVSGAWTGSLIGQ